MGQQFKHNLPELCFLPCTWVFQPIVCYDHVQVIFVHSFGKVITIGSLLTYSFVSVLWSWNEVSLLENQGISCYLAAFEVSHCILVDWNLNNSGIALWIG